MRGCVVTMPVSAQVREAVSSLFATLQRSLLALSGIVVGIGSVIALLTVGAIAKDEAVKQFEALGTDMLSLFDVTYNSQSGALNTILDISDARQLLRLPSIIGASPYTFTSGNLRLGGQQQLSAQRIGITAAFADIHEIQPVEGRLISPFDGHQAYAVIGAAVADALRESGTEPEIGTNLRMDDSVYTLVGVLPPGLKGAPGMRLDEALLIPIELSQRESGSKEILGITLRMAPNIHYLTATAEIKEHFARTAPDMKVRVDSPVGLIEQMEKQMQLFALLLGTVGGISLVVGGFGVMNAMLSSVSERRLEIGIRRALGARRFDIQSQFLAESSVMCVLGGAFGAPLGIGATLIISALANWDWQFSASSVGIGVGTACAVGLFFGYYPARQAARMDPITALRDG